MIRRYDRTETVFDHNKTPLHPFYAKVKERANSFYELELEVPNKDNVNKGDIITVPTQRGEQPFRVYNRIRTLLGKKIYARHIFYDLAKSFLIDVRPTNATLQEALKLILSTTETPNTFSGLSDVTKRATAYYIRKNPVEAIMGDDNSLLNRWGGYLLRDKKEIRIASAGVDRGYQIKVGKNLLGIEDESDETSIVTRLYPTVVINYVVIPLPEKYVDSPLMNAYGEPIIKEVRMALTDEEELLPMDEIYALMRTYCNNLYSTDNVDKPKSFYKVDFLQLKDDNSDFTNLMEKVELYDIVTTKVAELDIDVKLQVVEYEYNVLTERYDRIDLGDSPGLSRYQTANIIKQLQNEINQSKSGFAELWEYAVNVITGNVGGFQKTVRNAEGKPYETLWMDTDNVATAQKVLRINKEGIAGSINGVNGEYSLAITTDGWIVGENILAYSLDVISANLGTVTTGRMLSPDGTVDINLSNNSFKIGKNAEHTEEYSKYTHSDGSYTQISVNGLERVVSGSSKTYMYLVETGEFMVSIVNSTSISFTKVIDLPIDFIGKPFKATAFIRDIKIIDEDSFEPGTYLEWKWYCYEQSISVSPLTITGRISISGNFKFNDATNPIANPSGINLIKITIGYLAVY